MTDDLPDLHFTRAERDGGALVVTLDSADKRNAAKAAENPPLSNFAITSGIAYIGNMPASDAFFAEAFIVGVTNTQPASVDRLAAFMNKTAPKTLKQ